GRPTMGEEPECIQRFVDEARIAAQRWQANIVQVIELGKHEDSYFIAMEYVSGRDVRQLNERFRKIGRPMPIPQACFILSRVCEALDYAHRKRDGHGVPLGIVHRDISPQKVRAAEVAPPRTLNPSIPEGLEEVVLRSLAGDPRDRYQWASEMHDDLLRFTLQTGAPYGSRQLSEWLLDEYRGEREKEEARIS